MSFHITIADVAREAGVSRQTVSRVLNNKGEIKQETLLRVSEVIERLGYRPSTLARGLATHRTLTFGLIVPDIANPFFADISRGADDTAHAAGFSLLLCNTVEDPEREVDLLRTLEQRSVDGVVLCSSRLPEDDLVGLIKRHPAVVLINRRLESCSTVCVDDARGAGLLVRHLLSGGRRAIGCLAGPPLSYSGNERLAGFIEALTAAGEQPGSGHIVRCSQPDIEGGYHATRALLAARPTTDAIICYNDLVAAGALRACAELDRRVPDDIAIAGADDILLASLITPSLTTLRSDRHALGRTAVRLLLDQLSGGPSDWQSVVFPPELIVRASAP
jgi:LacI family transcriptional regulator